MSGKRKNMFENSNVRKKAANEQDDLSEFENLPSIVKHKIFNFLRGNDLKNLFLVSKNIKSEVESSRKLMNKLVLSLKVIDLENFQNFQSSRNYVNIKFDDELSLRQTIAFKDKLSTLNNGIAAAMSIEIGDFILTSAGDRIWKFKACKIDDLEEMKQFLSKVDTLDALEDLSLCWKLEDDTLLLTALKEMLNKNLKSLKNFELTHHFLYDDRPLRISSFLSNCKSTLQGVCLRGAFDTATYKILFNELPKLKTLILVPYFLMNQLSELDSFNTNHTVEILYCKRYRNEIFDSMFSRVFTKLSKVKVLYINPNGMTSEDWKLANDNMTELHSIYITDTIESMGIFKDKIFATVKTLSLYTACHSKSGWDSIAESFPNIKYLIVNNFKRQPEDFIAFNFFYRHRDRIENNLDIIPRIWKDSLDHLELGEGFYATIESFIKLLKEFRVMKTVVVSPDAFSWNMTKLMSDRDSVMWFINNGLQLFSLCCNDSDKMRGGYESCSLKSLMKSPSLSSDVEIKL